MRGYCLAGLLIVTTASPVAAQTTVPNRAIELSVSFSANSDNIANRPVLLIVDQHVSPFFSHGSGPLGFEVTVQRLRTTYFGFGASFSSYFDTFKGGFTYCQLPAGCGTGLEFHTPTRAFYATAGPVFAFHDDHRIALFGHALAGVVHARATFEATGTNVQYQDPFSGSGLILYNSTIAPAPSSLSYSDSIADTGFAAALGGGVKIRLTNRSRLRVGMDYDPTWLVRPIITDPTVLATTPSGRQRQDHIRLSIGVTWSIR